MLKAKVNYSVNLDDIEKSNDILKNINDDDKVMFLYSSYDTNINDIIKNIKKNVDIPIIGSTVSCVMTDEYIESTNDGFLSSLVLSDPNLKVGLAIHEAGNDKRAIGRKVAIKAVEDAKSNRAPAYFYMVSTPNDEEEYLKGIQDVIGRIPVFGGGPSSINLDDNFKIFCKDKIIDDGIAVLFIYSDNEINTYLTSSYRETKNVGIITEVSDNKNIITIDKEPSLKKYAKWLGVDEANIQGKKIQDYSLLKPLGIKSPFDTLNIVRQPIYGDNHNTKKISDDTILFSHIVKENTAIIQLETTKEEIIEKSIEKLKDLKKNMFREPACFFLILSDGYKKILGNDLNILYENIKKEAKNIPFIVIFTSTQYGYHTHSANCCGRLMLSYTGFSKK